MVVSCSDVGRDAGRDVGTTLLSSLPVSWDYSCCCLGCRVMVTVMEGKRREQQVRARMPRSQVWKQKVESMEPGKG